MPSGLANGSTYYWRARSTDENKLTGGWSAWQTVSVDTSPPVVSSVSSAQYPLREWGAVLGTSGSFGLTGGSDVAEFTWSVNSGSATTVAASGTDSEDGVGDAQPDEGYGQHAECGGQGHRRQHQPDLPAPVLGVAGAEQVRPLDVDETSGVTAADSGSGGSDLSPATVAGSVSFVPGYLGNAASFTGAGGEIATSGPVLDTTKSFTVMAWARASNLAAENQQVLVSQDGMQASRFQLLYDQDANGGAGGWCFAMRPTDGGDLTTACTDGSAWGLPADGVWVHLAGVYDEGADKIRVFVMGDPLNCGGETAEATFTGHWSATGSFAIGRGQSSGETVNRWRGEIDDVYAFQRNLSDWEICKQAAQ